MGKRVDLKLVFVSVDPDRDDKKEMDWYLGHF